MAEAGESFRIRRDSIGSPHGRDVISHSRGESSRRVTLPPSPRIWRRCFLSPLSRRPLRLIKPAVCAPRIGGEGVGAGDRQHVAMRAVLGQRVLVTRRFAPAARMKALGRGRSGWSFRHRRRGRGVGSHRWRPWDAAVTEAGVQRVSPAPARRAARRRRQA